MASILLHCCCAPCATYTIKSLREDNFEVTAFWYNPNIHPYLEHQKRLESMHTLAKEMAFPMIVSEGYDMPDYFRTVVGHEGNRCVDCYDMRLNKTAQLTSDNGFDAFCSTLLISPYQDQALIREVGEKAAKNHNASFYFKDFRDGFRESQQMARDFDLYRQKYCGCIYSEWERFAKAKII